MLSVQLLSLFVMSTNVFASKRRRDYSCSSDFEPSYHRRNTSEIREFETITRMIKKDTRISSSKPYQTPCATICDIPFNCFAVTCADKFTKLSYLAVRDLVMPFFEWVKPCQSGLKFYKRKESNIECTVYKLLLHVISTISPCYFDAYYSAFHSGNFYECFLILQRIYSEEAEIERIIIESIVNKNRLCRRRTITSICFVDPCTRECSVVDLPHCDGEKRTCLYLPRHCLKFEEFICLSFCVDDALICELDHFVPCGFKHFYYAIVKKFFKFFKNLPFEKRVLWWLRIKFFVFNCVGYSISHLSSGAKNQVLDLLIKTVTSENDAFYLAYARSLGLINK